MKNASIVDVVWGLGFVAVSWTVAARVDGNVDRQFLIVAMTTLWGVRLAVHLFLRNRGGGEDYRYRAMRKRWGSRFPLVSLATVFVLQGVLMWIVSLPVQLGQVESTPDVGLIAWIGVALWADRPLLRSGRRRPTRGVQRGSGERGPGDGPRTVAVHASSQLLR